MVTEILSGHKDDHKLHSTDTRLHKHEIWLIQVILLSDILHILAGPPPPLHFVWGQPSAVCTPCCLQLLQALLQVYCRAHFLGFRPVPLSHVTPQGPRVQRETRYSIHGITGGWSSERYHRGVIFIGRYQTRLFRLMPFIVRTLVRMNEAAEKHLLEYKREISINSNIDNFQGQNNKVIFLSVTMVFYSNLY